MSLRDGCGVWAKCAAAYVLRVEQKQKHGGSLSFVCGAGAGRGAVCALDWADLVVCWGGESRQSRQWLSFDLRACAVSDNHHGRRRICVFMCLLGVWGFGFVAGCSLASLPALCKWGKMAAVLARLRLAS